MKTTKLLFFAAAAISQLSPNAQAALLYWDGGTIDITANGDGLSQGGTGTWGGTTKNWDSTSGRAHLTWSKRYTAVFGGTAGTVTTSANQDQAHQHAGDAGPPAPLPPARTSRSQASSSTPMATSSRGVRRF